MTASTASRVSRSDIEAKLREIQGGVEESADQAKGYAVAVGAAIVAGLVITAFVLGRRRGRKKTTIVEIQRV